MPGTLNLDVHVDLVCPWCLIGKSHLRRALDRLAETDAEVAVTVQWHSVQLAPDVPPEGWPFAEFYERRLGGRNAVQARQAQVRDAAARAGVAIDFSRIRIFPNTARAHRLLAAGAQQLDAGGLDRLLDRLFSGYFERGEDLGDAATLTAIAAEHGIGLRRHGGPSPSGAISLRRPMSRACRTSCSIAGTRFPARNRRKRCTRRCVNSLLSRPFHPARGVAALCPLSRARGGSKKPAGARSTSETA